MPLSSDPTAYPVHRDTLDRALSSSRGISVAFSSTDAATAFRHRCYAFRKAYRKALSPETASPYDAISIILTDTTLMLVPFADASVAGVTIVEL
jgi:hypothetical protein